jgi:hypothetical protein
MSPFLNHANNLARRLWSSARNNSPTGGYSFNRPLLLLQSDDWGRVGVRDRDGYEALRARGIPLGQHPYDFYTLETAEDVHLVADLLNRHRDSTGRPPCLAMNFITANLDFGRIQKDKADDLPMIPLSKGLPGDWKRPGLFEAYRQGIGAGLFFPAVHGLTHFSQIEVKRAMAEGGEQAQLLRTLWDEQTPYIYWRMPWIGYEYADSGHSSGFLETRAQENLVRVAAENFARMFSFFPSSACAPGYRANRDTHAAWSKWGIRVAQNGSGAPLAPHFDEFEILQLYRTIDFEPSQRDLPVEKYLQLAGATFQRGLPVILSIHSLNFHSSLRNFRDVTLASLDQLLSALESKYSDLLYVNDLEMYRIVTQGSFDAGYGSVPIAVTGEETSRARIAAQEGNQ